MGICLTQNGYNLRSGTRGNTEGAKPGAAANPVTVAKYRELQYPADPTLAAKKHEAVTLRAIDRHRNARTQAQTGLGGYLKDPFVNLKVAGPHGNRGRHPPTREHGQAEFEKMAEFGVGSAGARVIRRGLGPSGLFVMQPTWMQMQLHIVSGSRDPAGDPPHRLVAKKGCLQRFHKESRAYPELGKAIQQKTQTLFLSADGTQHYGLGDRGQCGIVKITADAEFGVDRDADFDRFSGIHAL
jgi:hypothetical protein